MSNQTVVEKTEIQITSVRSRGASGGAIIAGRVQGGDDVRAVILDYKLLPDPNDIQKGQIWAVEGELAHKARTLPHGQQIREATITATRAVMQRPSGANLIDYIAHHPQIPGVGQVMARRLYDRFGPELTTIIEQGKTELLQTVVRADKADAICQAFRELNVTDDLRYLDAMGIRRSVGRKVVAFYGDETRRKIEEDPYRLLSFCGKWDRVDGFAQNKAGIAPDAPVRLLAAIEEALYRAFDSGSTAVPEAVLTERLRRLLEDRALTQKALALGENNGQFYCSGSNNNRMYHPAGAWLMESYIAQRLQQFRNDNHPGQHSLNAVLASLDAVIADYERQEGYPLRERQREAIATTSSQRFSLILGGAGVGKTTVLKGLYAVIKAREPFWSIYQLALSGKAAKRITESTGMESQTIAGFLRNVNSRDIPEGAWIVVDEASMVDVISFYRLLRHLPDNCRLILIGDPYQLQPVGPGLILHALVNTDIPQTTLTEVMRQTEASGIPLVAASIRSGDWPTLAPYPGGPSCGVSFVPCRDIEITETTLRVYEEIGGTGADHSVQILSPTKSGYGGTEPLNIALQQKLRHDSPWLTYRDEEHGHIEYLKGRQGFRHGDLVIFTRNDYELDLRNGSLGRVIEACEPEGADDPVCLVDFEGMVVPLTAQDLEYLELAYSITVHKSQGSQFERVIIPIRQSRLLDLTLLYTANTRGVSQVVLVGDQQAAQAALGRIAAHQRHTGLPYLLTL